MGHEKIADRVRPGEADLHLAPVLQAIQSGRSGVDFVEDFVDMVEEMFSRRREG